MTLSYKHTRVACYTGYVAQAAVNNLLPLLFVTLQREFALGLGQVTVLVSLNFAVQLVADVLAAGVVDRVGYRAAALTAHLLCVAGMLGLAVLPRLLPSPYLGLLVATVLNAAGGGIIEVIVSPVVEALPSDNKTGSMSLLHSFYCWGTVAVILLSTLFFRVAGLARWPLLALLWALVPLVNTVLFARVPLVQLVGGHEAQPPRGMARQPLFVWLFIMMLCSGAAEHSMGQWASMFAETGLGVSKTLGDLLGPCVFAALMGTVRVLFGLARFEGGRLEKALVASSLLCVGGYLLAVFAPHPLLSLVGCGLTGVAVGILWPGCISLASRRFPLGGTALFALMAVGGDIGCSVGPGVVGIVSGLAEGGALAGWLGSALKAGLLAAIVFPLLLALGAERARREAPRHKAAMAAEPGGES